MKKVNQRRTIVLRKRAMMHNGPLLSFSQINSSIFSLSHFSFTINLRKIISSHKSRTLNLDTKFWLKKCVNYASKCGIHIDGYCLILRSFFFLPCTKKIGRSSYTQSIFTPATSFPLLS